ncbi:MAG: prepilin peptidase, partial [Candidatus Aenigmatarchaeota archaeon]
MFEIVCLITALFGSCLAGVYDLKTTEIPDWIPYLMIFLGLILNGLESLISWNFSLILNSIIIGLGFLGFGFLMYYTGQWGGGDAKLLSGVGFLLPSLPSNFSKSILPFPASFLFNLFLLGAAYMLLYAFILALIKRKILIKFFEDVKASYKIFTIGSVFLFFGFILINFILSVYLKIRFELINSIKYSFLPLTFTILVFLLWKFAKVVEQIGFKQKIPV